TPRHYGEVGSRLERKGGMGARLVHAAELGMAGRDIRMKEGGAIGDVVVGIQCLVVAPCGVQHSGKAVPVPVGMIGVEPHGFAGPLDALLRSTQITQLKAPIHRSMRVVGIEVDASL